MASSISLGAEKLKVDVLKVDKVLKTFKCAYENGFKAGLEDLKPSKDYAVSMDEMMRMTGRDAYRAILKWRYDIVQLSTFD